MTEQQKNHHQNKTKENKTNLLNKAWSLSNDQVTSPKDMGKCKLLKQDYNFFFNVGVWEEEHTTPIWQPSRRIYEDILTH